MTYTALLLNQRCTSAMFPTAKNSFLSHQLKLFRVAGPQATDLRLKDYGALKNSYMTGTVAPSPGHTRHFEAFQ